VLPPVVGRARRRDEAAGSAGRLVLAGAAGTCWEGADGVDQAVDALRGNPLGPLSGSPGRPPPARDPEGAGGPGLWPPRGPTFRKDPAAGWLRNRIDPAKVCVLRPARRLPLTRSRHGPAREGPLPAALRATDPPPACRRKQLRRSVRDARGRQARSARARRPWASPGRPASEAGHPHRCRSSRRRHR